ncbi:putative ankyrin repeat protein L93 [Colletotrichum fructicola Nara gc5]|uniref:Putative ankyrin repeat protein L93 n=1 Tax=Colletotrichum fructicola (strain Nara gc5) TaxID=1213859 RepID=A0A7J6IES1_COLFN|nr:putative ankyrin repeat protein L93 [Colletotrichum fructicola Nara gc5]
MDVWTSQFDITANDIFTQKLVAKSQVTPLHVASAYGLNVVVKRILKDTPAAVEATDVHGRTPLCYAIRCPLTAVSTIRLLLRHQAKTNDCILLDDLEVSLLEYCCKKGLFSFAVCLLNHRAEGDLQHLFRLTLLASSTTSARRKRATLIERLIQRGADPNGVVRASSISEQPLLLDLALASPSATERLLDLPDIDINIQDSSGWTPLSRLLLQHHPNCKTVSLLLRRRAKLQPYSFNGILRLSTFWSLQELVTMLSRYANTVDLFRLLYRYCESHTAKDAVMLCFLASAAPQSRVLAGIPNSDLNDIRRGNGFILMHYFKFGLMPLDASSSDDRE